MKFGDVLTFATNKSGLSNHTAIYLGSKKMVHCINNLGVKIVQFRNLYRVLTYYYRLYIKE